MYTSFRTTITALALGLLGACTSYGDIRFEPNPLDVSLAQGEGGPPLGRALVSVRGIREVEDGQGNDDGHELAVVLRLDNESGAPVELLTEECEVVDASLDTLAPPHVARRGPHEGDPLAIAAGETAVFDLVFPFPPDSSPGDYDLQGLNLRWAVRSGERTVHVSSTFERIKPVYQPYYGYGYGYGYYPWFGYYGYHGWHCH
jgi:hypothetical protein